MSTARTLRLAAGLALLAALVVGCVAPGASPTPVPSPAGSATAAPSLATTPAASPTPDLRPVPLPPGGIYSGEVVDPALATLPLEEALAIGRAVPPLAPENNWIGTNPVARLMTLTNSHPEDGFGPLVAWVIVTDDAAPFGGTGLPTTSSPPPYNGTLSWTIVGMDGNVLDHVQVGYFAPNSPPPLPRD